MVITDMIEDEKTAGLEIHPVADAFPLMHDEALIELAVDIKENGLLEPIWLHEGKIIDGRNRYKACAMAGVEIETREWDGEGDLFTFVISLNLKRRHMTVGQRAIAANKIATMKLGDNQHSEDGQIRPPSIGKAAKILDVSPMSVKTARNIERNGEPEVVDLVEKGEMSLNQASNVVKLPTQEQREIANAPPAERPPMINRGTPNPPRRKTPEEKAAKEQEIYEIQTAGTLLLALERLARIDEKPDEVLAMIGGDSAHRFNREYGKAWMFLQALQVAYQKWEHRHVQAI